MMRILYLAGELSTGGADRQFIELIKNIDRKLIEPIVCTVNASHKKYKKILKDKRIDVISLSRKHKYDFTPLFKVVSLIKQKRINIIHTSQPLAGLYGSIAAKVTRRPVVCSTIRDAKKGGSFKSVISKHLQSSFADIFVSNSNAGFKNQFKKWKDNFRVVYNAVDFARFKNINTNKKQLKEKYNIDGFDYIVGMVANLTNKKDHDTLIETVPIVLRKLPKTCFVIAGQGSERQRIEDKCKKLNMEENVIFLGYIYDVEELISLFDVSILLTNTRNHCEGVSNSLLESMAMKVPVIATEGGGNNELIKNNISGILVSAFNPLKTANAITDLLMNKEKRKYLADNAYKYVKLKFSLKRYIRDYYRIYKQLINHASSNYIEESNIVI